VNLIVSISNLQGVESATTDEIQDLRGDDIALNILRLQYRELPLEILTSRVQSQGKFAPDTAYGGLSARKYRVSGF
jgi:hypothetical protein